MATNPVQGFPGLPLRILDKSGNLTTVWYTFFQNLWNRTGGATGDVSQILNTITETAGSVLYRGVAVWQGLAPGAQYNVLRMGAALPEWDTLDGKSFAAAQANQFFAGPDGSSGTPTFRAFATNDLDPTRGQYPASIGDPAGSGNLGEYKFTQVSTGAPISLANGTPKDVAQLALNPGTWIVWGNIVTLPDVTTTQTDIRAWISTASATDPGPPNSGAYARLQTSLAAGLSQTLAIGQQVITIQAGTTLNLSAKVAFATSTLSAAGFIGAIRPH